mmetsp:Transcript_13948/g.39492  ORF Transcript_13948/g.39492 Transcript_13948/m.39492 type:complete len:619 (+) Transcript_13948:121-1977(+)
MKQQLTHAMASDVVRHVESRLGTEAEAVHPLVLEAEIESAVVKHVGGEAGGPIDDAGEAGADKVTAEDSNSVKAKDSVAGKDPKGELDKGGKHKQAASSKVESFKAAIQDRANRIKQMKRTGLARASEMHTVDAHAALASKAKQSSEQLFNKIQERSAMGGIHVPPHQWLAEAERKNKERDKYSCRKLPQLPPPEQIKLQHIPPPEPAASTRPRLSSFVSAIWHTEEPRADPAPLEPPDIATLPVNGTTVCEANVVHVALTINHEYEHGAVALVYSILWNAACPARVIFHICHLKDFSLSTLLKFFPMLRYKSYIIDASTMKGTIRGMEYRGSDLENPLNYVRITLPHILPDCVERFIYLDTDTLMLGRVEDMFNTDLGDSVIASPEFCDYKLKNYFTRDFWANRTLSKRFDKKECYFNPGVLVVNAKAWRSKDSTKKLLHWMAVQKSSPVPLYTLGSLPPFLLVFAGEVAKMGMAWNEHDLGCSCSVIPVPSKAKLLHWSCAGKPWRRLRDGAPCSIDTFFWQPYDLLGRLQPKQFCDDGDLPKKVNKLPVLYPRFVNDQGVSLWDSDSGASRAAGRPDAAMSPPLIEQFFNKAHRRRCAEPVHIPWMQKSDGNPEL